MKRPYDQSFYPPAPTLEIVVSGPGGYRTLVARLDTAADVCGIPAQVALELDLPPGRRVRTSTYRGEPTAARLHRGDLRVAGRRFEQVEWLPVARPYALLGRSVLNELVLELDGPKLSTRVRGAVGRRRRA